MAESKPTVFLREATGLVRQLSARDIVMFNLMSMGLVFPWLYIFFAGSTYQGIYTPITVLLAMPANLIIAALYYYLTIAFPRTGGDYVWVSRIIHPAVGFMANFCIMVFIMSSMGFTAPWITTYGLGVIFNNLAVSTGSSYWSTLAAQVTTQSAVFAGGLVFVAVLIAVTAIGLRGSFKFQWTTFGIVIIGMLVFAGALLSSSPAAFKASFNTHSGANYDSIIGAASSANFVTTATLSGTVLGTFFSFLNFLGYFWATYLGGEVKRPDRTQLYGTIGSTLIFTAITSVMFALPFLIMGGSFINSASLLAGSGNSAYTLPALPVTHYLVIFANSSPIVAVVVPFALIAATFAGEQANFMISSRMIFAWAFDGVIPSRFANVSEKRGSPTWAVLIVSLIALLFIFATVYISNLLTVLAYSTSGIFIAIAIVGIAGLLLPRRKQLFAQTPPAVQRRIGGVPVISILGVLTFIVGIFVAYTAASPAFTGSPINPVYVGVIAVTFALGLVIYYGAYYYRKSHGLDLSLRFKEIPPE